MKKINVKKSMVYDANLVKASFEYLGEKGYFSNYKDFDVYIEGVLKSITVSDGSDYPYTNKYDCNGFDYFIPKSFVVFVEEPKEKKLRPFDSIQEFTDVTGCKIGDKITITCINLGYEDFCVFNGVRRNLETHTTSVMLGSSILSFDELMDYYLFYKDGKWHPFGIEE